MPRCNHIVFRVHDLAKSIRFYSTLIPATVVHEVAAHDRWGTRIAYLAPSDDPVFTIVLIEASRVRWIMALVHRLVPRQTRSLEHFGFECESRAILDERHAVAVRNGYRVLTPPTFVNERIGYVLEVVDPDGNCVELTFGKTLR
jgi:catechol 2,3-dioxygenase-like lactoylglutathione lyase family enzyme